MRTGLIALLAALAAAAPASAACTDQVAFDPAVPTWKGVNGFELGSRPATNEEVAAYLRAVDATSLAITVGELRTPTWRGRTLPYAIASNPLHLAPNRLAATAGAMRSMRDAQMSGTEIAAAAARYPAIVTVAAGVHGDGPSGTDATMRLLYELAARTDCTNVRRLDQLVTFIVPVQNPDGRAARTHGNAYGFDLDRDWFAATQPETVARLELLQLYPPMLFVDAQEEPGTGFGLPPVADPVHHEVPGRALRAVADAYAPAVRAAAARDGFDYDPEPARDLFSMAAGDAAASTAFGGGITLAKGADSPYPEKVAEQFAAQAAVLDAAAADKARLLEQWGGQWPEAAAQGRRGELEPNEAVQPGHQVERQVPDRKVFGYFLRAGPARADAARLGRRLLAAGVRVYRLREAARMRALQDYGGGRARSGRLPAGTFWIPLDQPLKHWVEAVLGEDPYAPLGGARDVAAWSGPLLAGLDAGFATLPERPLAARWDGGSLGSVSGRGPAWAFEGDSSEELAFVFEALRERARVIRSRFGTIVTRIRRKRLRTLASEHDVALRTVDATPPPRHSVDLRPLPAVALLEDLGASSGAARYVLERRFGVRVDGVSPAELEAGKVTKARYGALVVAAGLGTATPLSRTALSKVGRYVRGGGRYVGFGRQGVAVAAGARLTGTRELAPPDGYDVAGASLRMTVDSIEPLGWGFAAESWLYNVEDPILDPDPATGKVIAAYARGARFFASGRIRGADALAGTPAAIADEAGDGQSVVFAFDPAFRGWSDAMVHMLGNALLHPLAGYGARGI